MIVYGHCLPAGNLSELLQQFYDHPILHQKHVFHIAVENLPGSQRELLPSFYEEMVNKVGIQPKAASVAKVIRALGRLQRESDATALWHDWLVCPHPLALCKQLKRRLGLQYSPLHWRLPHAKLSYCMMLTLSPFGTEQDDALHLLVVFFCAELKNSMPPE